MTVQDDSPPWWLNWILWGFFALCIVPFLALCAFAHPSGDDWYMAAAGKNLGVYKASVNWYLTLTGRYTQQTLTSLHPIRWGITAYQVWCLVVLTALIPSVYLAVRRWLPKATSWIWHAVTWSAICLFLWKMPSPAQGLYWVNGLNTYVFAAILQFLLAAVVGQRCLEPTTRYGWGSYLLAALLAILAVGSCEIAMAFQVMFLAVLCATSFLIHRKVNRMLIMLMVLTVAATVAVMKAPGTSWRMTLYDNDVHGQLIPSLLMGAKVAVVHLVTWCSSAPVFLLSLLLFSFWKAETTDRRTSWIFLGSALILLVGTVWGGFFIGAWSAGKTIPPRAINLVYLIFVIDWIILLHAIVVWCKAHDIVVPSLNRTALLVAVAGLFASLASANNVKTAWRDLIKGDAARFSRESRERFELMQNATADEVTVAPLKTKPKSLYFNDFKPDSNDWRNTGAANFFGKKVIRLEATP